jgi:3-hydroxybutyryl-CoA dehydratase
MRLYMTKDKNKPIQTTNPKRLGRSIDEFKEGMTFEYSRAFTQNDTEMMGDLIGDHNLFHYEGDFIKNTKFKKPIVHGMLIGGMICHFGGDIFPGPGYLAEQMDFKFIKPVYFGDIIRAVGTVTAVDRERKRVSFHMNCYNAKNEIVLEGNVIGIPFLVELPDH